MDVTPKRTGQRSTKISDHSDLAIPTVDHFFAFSRTERQLSRCPMRSSLVERYAVGERTALRLLEVEKHGLVPDRKQFVSVGSASIFLASRLGLRPDRLK